MLMPRQPKMCQLDLFSNPCDAEIVQTPPWQALPEETRLKLTKLMVRLILDHVAGEEAARGEEVHHDA
jgi:hypothetical protein